jgi:hypothetical protein
MILRLINQLRQQLRLLDAIPRLQDELDALRSRADLAQELLDAFENARTTDAYQLAFDQEDPLVSVCVATYNRGELLVERCLRSILSQDYQNLEVIVVGDCCSDDTSERIGRISDPRLSFVNLPERGIYPTKAEWRWMVAGTTPLNHALRLARGQFITHLDDDDEYATNRIRSLVDFSQKQRAEFVWHPFWAEVASGKWKLNQAEWLASGYVTTSAIFYHQWFTCIPWDINAYRLHEPGDFNRIRKIKYFGLNAQRFPEPLLWHYKERNRRQP